MSDKNIQMPDGRVVAFPASMSDADIGDVLARDYIKHNAPGVPKPPDAIWQGSSGSNSGFFDQMPRSGSFDLGPSKVGAEVARRTTGDVTGGVRDIANGDVARGTHRIITGAGTAAAPILLPEAAIAAPAATTLGLGGGLVTGKLAQKSAELLGASKDQADLAGDVGGIVGGGVASKGVNLAPVVRRGAVNVLSRVSDAVDPDIVGLVSPRLAHLQRTSGKVADLMRPSATPPVFYDQPAGPPLPPGGMPIYYDQPAGPPLPANGLPAPYRQGPGSVVPEIVGPTNPNVLAGNKGVIVRPRPLLTGEVAPTEFPIAPPAPTGEVIKAPAGSPTGRADYLEDQAIREGMSNDLYRQAQAGGREMREQFEAGHSMDKPKYIRQLEAESQQIMAEAQQRAQQHIQDGIDKFQRPVTGNQPPATTGPVDLETALRQSITEAQAAKAAKQPIRVDFDENGNITDADGRHRVIEALQRGDKTIAVRTKLADGSVQTLNIEPAKVAEKMGVTPESLKATDEQQAPMINWKIRRR